MDRDLLFYFEVDNPHEGNLVLVLLGYKSSGIKAMMLSILPEFKQHEHKTELVFVIDRSSPMNGAGIQQANWPREPYW